MLPKDLFDKPYNEQPISIPDGELYYNPQMLSYSESDYYLTQFKQNINWSERSIKMYGKTLLMPRLTAWYADPDIEYEYSGSKSPHNDWTTDLLAIKQQVETISQNSFNSVLLNYYRDGKDSMAWHSDDEAPLGKNPVIASVSFGEERAFHLRHRIDKAIQKIKISLQHGSLLLMQGKTQHYWEHQLPKRQNISKPRINLTFRYIKRL